MWIDARYYEELLDVLEGFSEASYNFDERKLKKFKGTKYDKLTEKLLEIKRNSNEHIENSVSILDCIIEGEYTGIRTMKRDKSDYREIYDRYDFLIKRLETVNSSVSHLKESIVENGKITNRIDLNGISGRWLECVCDLNSIIDYFVKNFDELTLVVGNVARGDLSQKIHIDGKGEVLELKKTINTMVDQLSQFSSEVTRVAKEVGTDGLLGGQAKVEGVSGTWLDLTNNVNGMADSLTAQVRNIADVTTAVARGDLSQKITVDAKGEVLELKKTINTMVDQLSQFSSELTRVTKEVGTDGLLGGQAKVEGVSGTWLDLTNNVNLMSDSLAKVDIENKSQIWIKDGIFMLSKDILYKDMLSEQFHIAINHLSRYVNAGMGAMYIYNSRRESLDLEASYAYARSSDMPESFKIGEGVIGQVGADKEAILISGKASELAIKTGTTKYTVQSTYTSPLVFKDKLVGVVELATYDEFTNLQLEYVDSALAVLAGSFYASLQVRDKKILEEISIKDALTGLYNRGHFDELVPDILKYEKRKDGLICFAMLDIDFFKNFNDKYGHKTGDEVLKKVATVISKTASRREDFCFRIGGEEFAIIFSSSDKHKAFEFMKKINNSVEKLELRSETGESINNITISIGLTCKRATEIESFESLFEETDKLLYEAKESGRNKVVTNI